MIWTRAFVVVAVIVGTLAPAASAAKPVLDARPNQVRFGNQAYETFEMRTATITNRSSSTIVLTSDAGLPDDFSHLIYSTCGLGDKVLAARESCTHVVGFRPTPFFGGPETATLVLTARDETGAVVDQLTVLITGTGV
jgi:hypothetical protein